MMASTSVSPPSEHTQPSRKPLANRVAILDCGAQYTKVIDRRVRAMNLESDIFPLNTPAADLADYGAIILSGGPNSVHAESALDYDAALFELLAVDLGKPILGICYGMQLIAHAMGGRVEAASHQEYGETEVDVDVSYALFKGLAPKQLVLMSHGDHVSVLPPEFVQIATSEESHSTIVAAIAHRTRPIVGVQFHPEVELTRHGDVMLKHFLMDIAQLTPDFTLESRLDASIKTIRDRVGHRNVLTLVSGGVDSAVTTALLLKALGPDQVYALHIDTGMMRLNESDLVCDALATLGLTHLKRLNSANDFLKASTEIDGREVGPLNTLTQPEHKRRIIGDTFLRLTQKAIQDWGLNLNDTFIAQGTLRPDLIESGNADVSATAHTIKTHHNDVPMIQEQRKKGLIIEPNRDWHKDEVREIGRLCGLPEELVARQPFPGPGLGIRVLCAIESVVSKSDNTTRQELAELIQSSDLPHLTATLLPIRSVGVQGDARSYRQCVALSGFNPTSEADFESLYHLARVIPNRCHAVNRVILSLAQEPLPEVLTTIIPTTLTTPVLDVLRRVDAEVLATLEQAQALASLSQTFSVLLPVCPLDTAEKPEHSIVIRAVVTSDFMTARAAKLGILPESELPFLTLQSLSKSLIASHPVSHVFVDLTSKPPGTVEWE
jgi:GMP synthase (glutamine-hydrolysing)